VIICAHTAVLHAQNTAVISSSAVIAELSLTQMRRVEMIELLILIYLFTGLLLCGPSVKYYRSASDKAIIILISMFLWLPILVEERV